MPDTCEIEERACLVTCVLSAQQTNHCSAVQGMSITFKIWQGQEDLTVVEYASPLTVAQAKQALLEQTQAGLALYKKKAALVEWLVNSS